ncbi:MAG: DUF1178 family protein [Alphaproteobacteria bacterium]|jgi:hypothetical protein|nr:DUF1178 family protein [Alphaproteobacteria bacterium]
MIVYDVKCAKAHVFEGWFRDSAAFDERAAAGEIVCPVCGETEVAKAPMAPAIGRARDGGGDDSPSPEMQAEVMSKLREIRDAVEKNSEHVGSNFPEEARKIHYGETEARNIHGDATADEAKALKEEGVPVATIPWLPRQDS